MQSVHKTWLGHPRGLLVLFLTEMWERFSFYGMRSLLVLYLSQQFLFSDAQAQGLYAAYASLVYLTPLIGGFIADRYLGPRKSVLIGAVLLALGHFTMAIEQPAPREFLEHQGERWEVVAVGRGEERILFADRDGRRDRLEFTPAGVRFGKPAARILPRGTYSITAKRNEIATGALFLALSLIVIGVGFMKANISSLVGTLYEQGDVRRDSGFTIFYMGINVGSVLSTWLCGWLGIAYGWRYGFGLAGIGMLLGLMIFMLGTPLLEGHGEPRKPLKALWEPLTWIASFVAVVPLSWLIQRDEAVAQSLSVIAPAVFIAIAVYAAVALRGDARSRLLVAVVLILFMVIFSTMFDQAGSSITLYASRNSSLTIFGSVRMTAAQTNLFSPLFAVLLAPLFAWLWQRLASTRWDPGAPGKFAVALVQTGLGFLILVFGATHFATETVVDGETRVLVPLIWLFLAYMLQTMGEICIVPVGLSMITKLSPARLVGMMMGTLMLSTALAQSLAGRIAKLTSSETVGGVVVDPHAQLAAYTLVFRNIGWGGVAAGVLLFLIAPLLRRAMGSVK